jgi:hypothetical protein
MSGQRVRRGGRVLPRVEELEQRRVPTCNFIVSGSTLLIQGPVTPVRTNEHIFIFDNGSGGPNNVTAFCKAPFFPNVPISRVMVQTGAGDDRVSYNMTSNLVVPREVDVSLGAGNDQFGAMLRWNILTGGSLTLNVNGNSGNDRLEATMIGSLAANTALRLNFDGGPGSNILNVFSASFVNVGVGASVGINLTGNGFADHIFSQYQGQMNGSYSVNASGGRGVNNITADIEMAPGSTGTVLPSRLTGGPLDDTLTFVVHNPGTASSNNQSIDGRGGFDTCFRTTNVVVFSCESDTVLS